MSRAATAPTAVSAWGRVTPGRSRALTDAHLASDDVRVARECALPVSMVEHHDRMPAARDVVAREQGASDRRLDSQQREVAAGDRLGRRQADAATLPAVDRQRHEVGGARRAARLSVASRAEKNPGSTRSPT